MSRKFKKFESEFSTQSVLRSFVRQTVVGRVNQIHRRLVIKIENPYFDLNESK